MGEDKKLVFGTVVYAIDDILESDTNEDSYDDEILIDRGEPGKFIAYLAYDHNIAIIFFEPDTILQVPVNSITTNIAKDMGYPCYVCGAYNNIEQALEGCKGCGIPYNPIDGNIGDSSAPDVTEELPF